MNEKPKGDKKMQKYMRAKEVAEYFGIGLSTVWKYAKDGKLHPKKLSDRVTVFSIEELETTLTRPQPSGN